MRKRSLIFVVLMSYSTLAQVSSGTIIITNITKDKVVVAADSLSNRVLDHRRVPNYSQCKLEALSHQFIFTSGGNTAWWDHDAIAWDNFVLARNAIRSAKKGEHGAIDLDDGIRLWASDVKSHWDRIDRQRVAELAAAYGGQITAGAFIGKELTLRVGMIYFNASNMLDPIQYRIGRGDVNCWPCGQLEGSKICGQGIHLDVASKFCSERKHGDRIDVRTRLQEADESTKLPVKIIEMSIDTYGTTKDIGGSVDAVTMTKDGRITWNSRKANCPEN